LFLSATVAQQAEQLICNQRVGGSIPFGGSIAVFGAPARTRGLGSALKDCIDWNEERFPSG
jgi:hypothetical protein